MVSGLEMEDGNATDEREDGDGADAANEDEVEEEEEEEEATDGSLTSSRRDEPMSSLP